MHHGCVAELPPCLEPSRLDYLLAPDCGSCGHACTAQELCHDATPSHSTSTRLLMILFSRSDSGSRTDATRAMSVGSLVRDALRRRASPVIGVTERHHFGPELACNQSMTSRSGNLTDCPSTSPSAPHLSRDTASTRASALS